MKLIRNAIKYGALSIAQGRVNNPVASLSSADEDWIDLRWGESGRPLVIHPERIGFGSRHIERGVAAELSGEASLIFEETVIERIVRAPVNVS